MLTRRALFIAPLLAVPLLSQAPRHGEFIGLWYNNGPFRFAKPWLAAAWYHGRGLNDELAIAPLFSIGDTAAEALNKLDRGIEGSRPFIPERR